MTSDDIQRSLELGIAHQRAGRFGEAEHQYRAVLAQNSNEPRALYHLATLANRAGQHAAAEPLLRRSIELAPHVADPYNSLAIALKALGRLAEAETAARKAAELAPQMAEAHNTLGNVLYQAGRAEEAVASFERALSIRPDLAVTLSNMGSALAELGRTNEALAAFSRAQAINANLPDVHTNLGNALLASGRVKGAIEAHRAAVQLNPRAAYSWNSLGNSLREGGDLDGAADAFRHSIGCDPAAPFPHSNLGNVLKDQALLDEALAAYRTAIQLKPDYAEAHSNLVYLLHFHPDFDARAILEEHRNWARVHADPLALEIRGHDAIDRDPDRKLRIGYVSPDLRSHPVGRFLLPLLERHDHAKFAIVCYSDTRWPDEITERLKSCADEWCSTAGMHDAALAEKIRADRIDILVDLTLHMARNRMLVFARKPAPVQVTYLAYAGTSGMSQMDYRITDVHLDPPNRDEVYTEKSLRLPRTYWCYQPPEQAPELTPPPLIRASHVTFGCLNNFSKMNSAALDLWRELMRKVPDSRLILHADHGAHRARVLDRFAAGGVDRSRIEFVPTTDMAAYLQTYNRIDIALDPFPYNGGTTTCDALWMGVPVVTLAGATAVGRAGVSLLTNIGLTGLVARSPEQYLAIARDLAGDAERLRSLRSGLRDRMLASPLCDAPAFARDIEGSYRCAWRTHCGGST